MTKHAVKDHKTSFKGKRTVTSLEPETPYDVESTKGSVPENIIPDSRAIALKAYQIHQQKGGSDMDNWLEAERLLREEERNIPQAQR